jgi:hypothetical protein
MLDDSRSMRFQQAWSSQPKPAAGTPVDQQVRVGGGGPASQPGLEPCAQVLHGKPVERPGAAAEAQSAGWEVGVVQGQGADVAGAQGVHAGQQDDEPLGGVVQVAEQATRTARTSWLQGGE